jgi:hypothetical protein
MLEHAKRIAIVAVAGVALTGAFATASTAYGAAEESGPTAASKDGGEAGSAFALAGGDGGANVVAATDRGH